MAEENSVLPLDACKLFCSTYWACLCLWLHMSPSLPWSTPLLVKSSSALTQDTNPPHIFLP